MTLNTITGEVSGQLPTTWIKAGENTFSNFSFANATILNTSTYDAFGVLIKTGADTVLYYYRQGSSHFGGDGVLRRIAYTISTGTWGSPSTVYTPAEFGVSGVAGGIINGNIMLFFVLTDDEGDMQSIGSILSTDGLTGSTFAARETFDAGDVRYEAYGHLVHCEGQVYIQPWFSHNGSGTYKANIRRTTDNGATWTTINIQTSSTPKPAEVEVVYVGSNRLIAIGRNNSNGYLIQSTSSDNGLNWTAFQTTNMGNPSGIANATLQYEESSDRVYVCFADRTAAKIVLGYATVDEVFENPLGWQKQMLGTTATVGGFAGGALGYPSMQLTGTAGDLLVVWNDERIETDADIKGGMWVCRDAVADGNVRAIFPKGGTQPFGFTRVSTSNPVLKSAAVYEKDAIQFTAASSQHLFSLDRLTSTAGTIFIVGKTSTLTDYPSLLSSYDEGGSGSGISLRANGASGNQNMEIAEGANRIRGSSTIEANTEYCWVFASSGAANGYDFRIGATQQTEAVRSGSNTGNWFGDFTSTDNTTIGAEKASSATQFFNGQIAEIVIYPTLLSSEDIDAVSAWLVSTVASIEVTSPVSTDRRIVGLAEAITWNATNVDGTVDILISIDNGETFATLAAGQTNDGTYQWTPTDEQIGTQVIIRIRSTEDTDVYDDSAAFRVATTAPSGGGTNTDLWYRLRAIAIDNGMELIEQ